MGSVSLMTKRIVLCIVLICLVRRVQRLCLSNSWKLRDFQALSRLNSIRLLGVSQALRALSILSLRHRDDLFASESYTGGFSHENHDNLFFRIRHKSNLRNWTARTKDGALKEELNCSFILVYATAIPTSFLYPPFWEVGRS